MAIVRERWRCQPLFPNCGRLLTTRRYCQFGRFSGSDRQTRFWRFSPFFHSNRHRIFTQGRGFTFQRAFITWKPEAWRQKPKGNLKAKTTHVTKIQKQTKKNHCKNHSSTLLREEPLKSYMSGSSRSTETKKVKMIGHEWFAHHTKSVSGVFSRNFSFGYDALMSG